MNRLRGAFTPGALDSRGILVENHGSDPAKRTGTPTEPILPRKRTSPPKSNARGARRADRSEGASKNLPPADQFAVVGIGASAGGLEAVGDLLTSLPSNIGMAFVVIQHLDPTRPSALATLLARTTALPVNEVDEGTTVQPNHVYIIPPNREMIVAKGRLRLAPKAPSPGGLRSIDAFFESLASDLGARAIGVVLSGTGHDGSLGLEAIRAEGGLTFAQDETAKYDSMPKSAIAAGTVDAVLSATGIAEELARIARHPLATSARQASTSRGPDPTGSRTGGRRSAAKEPRTRSTPEGREPDGATAVASSGETDSGQAHQRILGLLRQHCGIDFRLYKPSTVTRRLHRRMVLNNIETPEDYARFLRKHVTEMDALHTDMLIPLTAFFRNPDAFNALNKTVLAKLLRRRDPEKRVRLWVAGCSTGQEAYSLAMAFLEAAPRAAQPARLQVFATDVSQRAVEVARVGRYPSGALRDLPQPRIQRWFEEDGPGWFRVRKSLRERIVFAQHDLLRNPPFSHLDLISCRNVLIYLGSEAQRRVFQTFAHALDPGGFLFLGAAESAGAFEGAFVPIDGKHKIYERSGLALAALHPAAHLSEAKRTSAATSARSVPAETARDVGLERTADRVALGRYAPRGALLDSELRVVEFRGDTRPWLKPPVGKATFDVCKLVHDALVVPLRSALREAKRTKEAARREARHVWHEQREHAVQIEVIPLRHSGQDYFLVCLDRSPSPAPSASTAADGGRPKSRPGTAAKRTAGAESATGLRRRVADLGRDLAEAQDDARALQEQHDALAEEMNATIEEATSANEELQSLNEEVEAGKEELESANEELTTVNDEMARQNALLNRTAADLSNTEKVAALEIIIVGDDASVRRFTPAAAAHFALGAGTLGQPLQSCRGLPEILRENVASAIGAKSERTFDLKDQAGRWYAVRVAPYCGPDEKLEGAVISLLDVDARKMRDEYVKQARDYAEAIIHTVRDGLLVLDSGLRVLTSNEAFYAQYRTSEPKVVGKSVFDLANGQWNTPILHNRLDDMVARNSAFDGLEVTHDVAEHSRRTFLVGGRVLREPGADSGRILIHVRDITESMQFQVSERAEGGLYRRLFESDTDGVLLADVKTGSVREANERMLVMIGCTAAEARQLGLADLPLSKRDGAPARIDVGELRKSGSLRPGTYVLTSRSGVRQSVEVRAHIHEDVRAPLVIINVRERQPTA